MPFNPIAYQQDDLSVTGSTTLGYGPGQTLPPSLLIYKGTAGGTIVLPPISTVLPTPPATLQATVGTGMGFRITIRNNTSHALTVSPAGSDTIVDTLNLGGQGSEETLQASPYSGGWYRAAMPLQTGAIRTAAGATTLTSADRYVVVTGASTFTIPAPSNFPVGVEFASVINASAGPLTLTPASGNINGATTLSLATQNGVNFLTDGTNFFAK